MDYEENHKMVDGLEYKKCRDCDQWLPMTEEYFYKNESSKQDGFNPYCKEDTKRRSMEWKKENIERKRESANKYAKTDNQIKYRREFNKKQREQGYSREWQQRNKDKVKEYNEYRNMHKKHEISKKEKENCKAYFNYSCAYCGISEKEAKENQGQNLHMDHVNPNGANDLSNNIPACRICNSSKHDRLLKDWYNQDSELMVNIYSSERLQKILKWLNEDYKLYMEFK